MVSNKGYVLTPLIIALFAVITLFVYSFRSGFIASVNDASYVMGLMDNAFFNQSKTVLLIADSFKLMAYGNLSDSALYSGFLSTHGGSLVDNPVFLLNVPSFNYSSGTLNLSFSSSSLNVVVNYPLSRLVDASSLVPFRVNSLKSLSCDGFIVNDYRVEPLSYCSCNAIIDFVIFNRSGGLTLLYPFIARNILVPC